MKVLLIEDDLEVVNSVSLAFKLRWPETVIISTDEGTDGIDIAETESPNIIILDIDLPDRDGFEVLKQIRLFSDVPIIILSTRDAEMDKVKGLEMGADDYIVNPFSSLDFLARVKAILRRTNMHHAEEETISPLTAGDFIINFSTREVLVHDQPLSLTPIEYRLLFCLARSEGRLVPHHALQQQVWGGADYVNSSTVKKYIHQLRTKLGDLSNPPQMIVSERGRGYKFIRPRKNHGQELGDFT